VINQLPHSRIPLVNKDGTPTREFFNFLRDLLQVQIPIGGIIASLSNVAPKGFLAMGSTYSRSLYPQLFAVLGTESLPDNADGLYLADASTGLLNTIFGDNAIGLQHRHTPIVVMDASGTGATVSGADSGNLILGDNRPKTLGVKFYVRAE
tara:strand:+ start:5368 stop:5820 length:453 start_codon:yes stop_codon:yes gene_type:complete